MTRTPTISTNSVPLSRSVTVEGTLLYVNDRAADTVAPRDMLGTNILDCHPEPARIKFEEMLASGQANIYTIERAGQRKLICQAPWYVDGVYAGFMSCAASPWGPASLRS